MSDQTTASRVAHVLLRVRLSQCLTEEEVAKTLAIHPDTLLCYEHNIRPIPTDLFLRWCDALHHEPAELILKITDRDRLA